MEILSQGPSDRIVRCEYRADVIIRRKYGVVSSGFSAIGLLRERLNIPKERAMVVTLGVNVDSIFVGYDHLRICIEAATLLALDIVHRYHPERLLVLNRGASH